MKIVIASDRAALGGFSATQAAELLRSKLAKQSECNLVVATGSSQFEVLDALVQAEGIDWNRINGFHLDEYLGLARSHSASFCGYLSSRFVDRVPLKSFFFMDGTIPAEQLKAQADAAIAGKTIDLLLCGIGENGHLAFNDPPADFEVEDPYLIVELDEACRKQQVGEGWFDSLEGVPKQAISMSIRQIMRAQNIICTVPDRRKAAAVGQSLEEEISPQIPASILREHDNVTLVLDNSSSSQLSEAKLASCEYLDAASN